MSQLYAALLRQRFQYGGVDLLPDGKPAGGVRDAGDGDMFNADHGDQSAADVHKSAEGLHMGDCGGNDHPGLELRHQGLLRNLLGSTTGENQNGLTVRTGNRNDRKADRLAHAGQDGDLLGGSFRHAQSGVLSGNTARKRAYGNGQIVVRAAGEGAAL